MINDDKLKTGHKESLTHFGNRFFTSSNDR